MDERDWTGTAAAFAAVAMAAAVWLWGPDRSTGQTAPPPQAAAQENPSAMVASETQLSASQLEQWRLPAPDPTAVR